MNSDDNTTSLLPEIKPADPTDGFLDDADSLSDDERDLILAQLYHSAATLSTSKPNTLHQEKTPNGTNPNKRKIVLDDSEAGIPSTTEEQPAKSKKKITFDQYINSQPAVPSVEFTFELDLDNLPSPPKPTPVEEVPSLDEDDYDDYVVTPSFLLD